MGGMVNEERLGTLFRRLCEINAPPLKERARVDFVASYLSKLGLEVWEDKAGERIGGNANNLYARLRGTRDDVPKIFFSAHFDTVEPTEGLRVVERDGCFYSDGTTILGADDKAGMAPAIEAVQCLQESGMERGDVFLIFTVAEEIGLKGARESELEGLGVHFGYVLDTGPPVGSFINRVGSHDKFVARILGKPAHSGKDPEEGISAIQACASGIARMRLGRIDEDTTANVGLIRGGTAMNVVPAEVEVIGEARSYDLQKLHSQMAHMRECLEEGAREWGARLEWEEERMYLGYEVPESAEVLRVAREAASRLGFEGSVRATLGGSDANIFHAKGVPALVCGTGMREIHTHQEFVSRKDLVDLTRLLLEIVRVVSGS
jgi:tripeptide aminopeptidase